LERPTRQWFEHSFGHEFGRVKVNPTTRFANETVVNEPDDPCEREADLVAKRIASVPFPQRTSYSEVWESAADLGQVRIHRDHEAHYAAKAINARAFTTGRDIFFREGQYSPDTLDGRHLLAHELAHVMQFQRSSSGPAIRRTVKADADRIESLLSYSVFDWAITETEALEALDIISNTSPELQAGLLSRINIDRLRRHLPATHTPILERILKQHEGENNDLGTAIQKIQKLLSYGLFDWRISEKEALEAYQLLMGLPPDAQKRAILVINYDRLLSHLPAESQREALRSLNTRAASVEAREEAKMKDYGDRAKEIIAQLKIEGDRLQLDSPPDEGRFERFISYHYLAEYCRKPTPKSLELALAGMTAEGTGGFTYGGYPLLADMMGLAMSRGVGFIDSPYLLGEPAPDVVSPKGDQAFDPWSQGPNPTQIAHFAGGVKWSWAPTALVQWFFVHYEKVSGEGWQLFGLDSLNDIIAEEAGRLLARDLRSGMKCPAPTLSDPDEDPELAPPALLDLDPYFAAGRAFLRRQLSEQKLDELAQRVHLPDVIANTKAKGSDVLSLQIYKQTIMEQLLMGASDQAIIASPDARVLILLYRLLRRG
jgi:hypothetical protein